MDAQLSAILAEIRPRLGEWYPGAGEGGSSDLEVMSDDVRALNRVVRLDVRTGGRRVAGLIVKTSVADSASAVRGEDRPRLVPLTAHADRPSLEFDALRLVEHRLAEVGDERFAAIRPLGVLEASSALVMEAFPGRPLQRLLLPAWISRPATHLRPQALAAAAGGWLRILHDTGGGVSQESRQASPAELAAAFDRFGAFLVESGGPPELAEIVEVGKAASGALAKLPLVLSHGDFAPRNILVDRRGRIAVIDLLARWRAPRYEDVAAFLVAMHASRANAATQGLLFGRAIDRLEPAFLAGYFGDESVTRLEIRVFELLLLLDKWSARMVRRTAGARRGFRDRLIDRYFGTRSRSLARAIAADL